MNDKQLRNKAINIQGKAYVLVADRINFFNDTYPNGSIQTEELENESRVEFKATVVPDVDKPARFFTGHSQAVWGNGMVNKTAATENAETSAVGRALAMMGIGVIESVASADELNKAKTQPATTKFATAKQIDWMRDVARRVSGLEHQEDVDGWITKVLTIKPQQVPVSKVKSAVDRIESMKEKTTEAEMQALGDAAEVTDEDFDKLAKGELPY